MKGMFTKTALTLLAGATAVSTQAQSQSQTDAAKDNMPKTDVTGRWLTDDKAGVVEIAPCGKALCGHLVAVLDPKAPALDANNPDPAKRSRALVGIPILTGLTPQDGGWGGGEAYDPKSGNSYRASIRIAPDGRLDVTGCVLVVCRTRHWTRSMEEKSR